MELSEAIARFKKDLEGVKADGRTTTIEIANLERYLDALSNDASDSIEHRKMALAGSIASYNAQVQHDLENFRVVIEAGKEAINAAILINGGAVIALMAFVGNAAGHGSSKVVIAMAVPLLLFGYGALFGGLAFGGRYISQFCYAASRGVKRPALIIGHILNGLTWLVTLLAFLAFARGVFEAFTRLSYL
jgi:hypothetical protein